MKPSADGESSRQPQEVDFRDEFYARLKGPRDGYCRICGAKGELKYDHVPPKSIFNSGGLTIKSYPYQAFSQAAPSGLKIRSISEECNSGRLGGKYDPELIAFATAVAHDNFIRSSLLITGGRYEHELRSRKILKSVLGHLLSAYEPLRSVSEPVETSGDYYPSKMRRFILQDDSEIVNDVTVNCWFHPYPSIFIVPFFTIMVDHRVKEYISGSIFKFYPLAFFIYYTKDLTVHSLDLPKLRIPSSDGESVRFTIDLSRKSAEKFPFEPVPPNGVVLGNRESCYYARRDDSGRLLITVDKPTR